MLGGNNGNVAASASGGTPNYTYLWNTGAVGTYVSNLSAGTYTVTATDAGVQFNYKHCCYSTHCASLSMSSTDVTVNGGNDGTATVVVSGGTAPYTYTWNTLPVQGGNTAIGLTAGTYQVTVIDLMVVQQQAV